MYDTQAAAAAVFARPAATAPSQEKITPTGAIFQLYHTHTEIFINKNTHKKINIRMFICYSHNSILEVEYIIVSHTIFKITQQLPNIFGLQK